MIQLGYYPAQQQQDDGSMDFDPNYDPSDFLMKKDSNVQVQTVVPSHIQQYQENYDYEVQEGAGGDEIQIQQQQNQNYYGTYEQQSAFNVDYSFQTQQTVPEDFSQQQQQQPQMMIPDGGGLADLEISDSDDEDQEEENNTSENQADTSKDDDGLWF